MLETMLKKLEPFKGRKTPYFPPPFWNEDMLYQPTYIPAGKRRYGRVYAPAELQREKPIEKIPERVTDWTPKDVWALRKEVERQQSSLNILKRELKNHTSQPHLNKKEEPKGTIKL